jgi:hypothetical protein
MRYPFPIHRDGMPGAFSTAAAAGLRSRLGKSGTNSPFGCIVASALHAGLHHSKMKTDLHAPHSCYRLKYIDHEGFFYRG